jgi:Transposase DDE domain
MAAHTHVAVGYNVQVAVDTKHKLIVEQQVTNQVLDMGLLTETAEPAKQILDVEQIAVVADRGYFKIEDIEACEKAGMEPYVPRPQRGPSVRAGLFRKDEFAYDPETDTVICPGGQRLSPYSSSVLRGLKKINYVNRRVAIARSARDARTTAFDPSPAWRTRPCSTGCRPDWLSDHKFSRNAAKRWSIRLAQSNNG